MRNVRIIVASIFVFFVTMVFVIKYVNNDSKFSKILAFVKQNQAKMPCGTSISLPPEMASETIDGMIHIECLDSHPVAICYLGMGRGENFTALLWSRDRKISQYWEKSATGDKYVILDKRIMYLSDDRGDGVYYVGRYDD